jgi:hypothetical protein
VLQRIEKGDKINKLVVSEIKQQSESGGRSYAKNRAQVQGQDSKTN